MATVTLVQDPTPTLTGTALTGTIVFGSNVTSGDLLVCFARGAGTTLDPSDTLGDSVAWTQLATVSTDKKLWCKIAGATAACTITITTNTSGTIRIAARQYHSDTGWLASPADGTAGTFSGVSATPTTSASTITAGSLASALYAGASGTSDFTPTAGSSPVNADFDGTHSTLGWVGGEDQLSATGGSMTAGINISTGTTGIVLQGYLPAVAGAGPVPPPYLSRFGRIWGLGNG